MERRYYSRYELAPCEPAPETVKSSGLQGFLGKTLKNTALDDLILIAVIFILITDEQPDFLTILALLYIFVV